MQALADGNQAYEHRFGHIYLVCATGRSGPELLALLQERLGHDPAAEWQVVRSELEKINRIRLRKLLVVHSLALQQTLSEMGRAVLAARPTAPMA